MSNQSKTTQTTNFIAKKYSRVSKYTELSDTELVVVAGGGYPRSDCSTDGAFGKQAVISKSV